MGNNHLVYKTTNKTNGKIYIGVHSTNDINDKYLGSGTAFKSALKKHGIDNFKKEILHNYKKRASALKKEKEIVDHKFVLSRNTYNLVLGGGSMRVLNKLVGKSERETPKQKKWLKETTERIIKSGFKDMTQFMNFAMEFSTYSSIIKYQANEPMNIIEVGMLKAQMENGFKADRNKLNQHKKNLDYTIRMMQYIIYGK